MMLREINYQGFRNLSDTRLEFGEDFNLIIGENGSGKTNLLEAIFYVCLASSFRAKEERNLIRHDGQFLKIEARTNGHKAFIYLDENKKRLMLQDNEIQRLSDFVGWCLVTMLSIDDIWIIRGAPANRRYFLDWFIAKISPSYLADLIEYRKILRQRARVLQMMNEEGSADLLDVYDEQLINYGNQLYRAREEQMPGLRTKICDMGDRLGLSKLDLTYQSTCPDMVLDQRILRKSRPREMLYRQTIVGPHRDDLLFSLNDRVLKFYASEGESRVAVIALKLAEAEILGAQKGVRPILLLDEVGAELDAHKKEALLGLLKGQVFYASTQKPQSSSILGMKTHRVLHVKRGEIEVSRTN